jgi:hypothetical protein
MKNIAISAGIVALAISAPAIAYPDHAKHHGKHHALGSQAMGWSNLRAGSRKEEEQFLPVAGSGQKAL